MKYKLTFTIDTNEDLFSADVEVNDIHLCIQYNDDDCKKLKFEIKQIECEKMDIDETDVIKSY